MNKNYNVERTSLQMPEYGRHIHDMVDELMTIENRAERNRRARVLVAIMANIKQTSKESGNPERRLWDHLYIMSDFKLDVDSPYPVPTPKSLAPTPARLRYPEGRIAMKHYGKNVRNVVRVLEHLKNQQVVDTITGNLARYMRTKSYEYNQEHPNNEVIIKDIKRMALGTISVDEEAIGSLKSDYKQNYIPHNKKGQFQKKNNKNQKNQKNQPRRNYK
ncbi:MAG: DUF4290 domain-containing protein [Tidjanibacter sp.]|nr:DUF4290 domain-containing protein [Tidjanibacter sp.]